MIVYHIPYAACRFLQPILPLSQAGPPARNLTKILIPRWMAVIGSFLLEQEHQNSPKLDSTEHPDVTHNLTSAPGGLSHHRARPRHHCLPPHLLTMFILPPPHMFGPLWTGEYQRRFAQCFIRPFRRRREDVPSRRNPDLLWGFVLFSFSCPPFLSAFIVCVLCCY
ncbi:hypothetical protein L208DRAFT_906900 [Tricholoma matsutake]|nr:hypothetical protein L208DRAFT_906900 [Tricholoma matsutake 945]